MKSPLEQFDVMNIKNIYTDNMDMSINSMFMPTLSILMFISMYIYFNIYKSNFMSMYVQQLIEYIYMFLNNLMKQQAGSYGLFWFPFVFCLFNFILFSNFLSLMPYGMALTSHFILMFWLSCTICASIFVIGLLRFNLKFLHIFMPQSPFLLLPLLMPIEIFSYLMSLLSLAMSLAANLIAGHTLVHIMMSFFLNVMKIDSLISILVLMPLFFMLTLELGVAFLQAYVFTVLFCIYLSDTEKGASH